MIKDNISLYDTDRVPMSLRDLPYYDGKDLTDLFYAVSDASDFDDLTERLRSVISIPFAVDYMVTDKYIRYVLIEFGNKVYLRIDVERKKEVNVDA